ncbi:MAG: alpha/beta hydrolase family protein [Petrimonas sp.]|nr:alpha/beta hydrolase family protein [Petrimonas sp.]OJV32184.1 MAG: XynC protein [Bacteroidia bacterium 43-41]
MNIVKRLTFSSLFLIGLSAMLHASKVDTVKVFSPSMQKEIKTVVITPDAYSQKTKFPVLYLLHGYSDNYGGWVNRVPVVKELADRHNMIIVCPDGAYGSWYFDSPVDPGFKYETFVSKELTDWVDKNYNTVSKREGRAITGLSMGGHGGLYLGFRHQDVYGACGSMSGGVDIRPFPNNWDLAKRLGSQRENPENWEKNTVMNQLYLLTPNSTKIIFDCGTDDFFYEVNVKLHQELLYRNIPHDFISRPGVHNWEYWTNAIKYQVLFFSNYFNEYEE